MGNVKSKFEQKNRSNALYKTHTNAKTRYENASKEALVVTIIEKLAIQTNVLPSYLYTVAIMEGLQEIRINDHSKFKKANLDKNNTTNNYQNYGSGFFSAFNKRSVKEKYLPKSCNKEDAFEKVSELINKAKEKETEYSANLKNIENDLWAIAAVLKQRADRFERDWKALGYKKPTEDEWAFWVYFYYQRPELAFQKIKELKGYDIFYLQTPNILKIRTKALESLAAWRYIQHYKIFSK